jgi:hypothetical protein
MLHLFFLSVIFAFRSTGNTGDSTVSKEASKESETALTELKTHATSLAEKIATELKGIKLSAGDEGKKAEHKLSETGTAIKSKIEALWKDVKTDALTVAQSKEFQAAAESVFYDIKGHSSASDIEKHILLNLFKQKAEETASINSGWFKKISSMLFIVGALFLIAGMIMYFAGLHALGGAIVGGIGIILLGAGVYWLLCKENKQ